MKQNKPLTQITVKPTRCHLWTKNPLEWEDMQAFVELERYVDESHLIRKLVKCSDCGQLYYYEFYEEIDWDKGEDLQYRLFMPIANKEAVKELNKLSNIDILQHTPRLQFDWTDKKNISWIK